ncbi:MAG: hypothetical protein ACRDV4_05810, partial [Acidimicrobiales bacterium]
VVPHTAGKQQAVCDEKVQQIVGLGTGDLFLRGAMVDEDVVNVSEHLCSRPVGTVRRDPCEIGSRTARALPAHDPYPETAREAATFVRT